MNFIKKYGWILLVAIMVMGTIFLSSSPQLPKISDKPICKSLSCTTQQVACQLDDNKKICSLNELDCSNGIDATKKNYGLGGIVLEICGNT